MREELSGLPQCPQCGMGREWVSAGKGPSVETAPALCWSRPVIQKVERTVLEVRAAT